MKTHTHIHTHGRQDNEHFYHLQVSLYPFVFLLSRTWATTDLLSITLDSFAFSRILHKSKSYSIVCSFCLVSFTQYNCLEIYLLHIFRAISFHYWVLFHCIDILHFIYPFLFFQFLAVTNIALTINIMCKSLFGHTLLFFSSKYLKVEWVSMCMKSQELSQGSNMRQS